MSFFSIGRNEIQSLLEKERELKNKIHVKDDGSGVVKDFQDIMIKKELEKVHTKLKILGYRPDGDGDVA
ncbi:MAG: hypothetical protein LBE97_02760 [Holosporales bacterium]|jgi:hypothetical protein|nr:hypothetical protein [Holosporales bacterium]